MPGKAAHRRDWEAIAALDPHWAVLAEPERKHGRWDEDEFSPPGSGRLPSASRSPPRSGCRAGVKRHWTSAVDSAARHGRSPLASITAWGIDISETMLTRARELNAHLTNLELIRADGSEPLPFADESFDTVYSSIVLQHLPGHGAARAALRELARVTASEGLLCFQLPSALGLAIRLQPRRTAYRTLRAVRVPERVLYDRLGIHPVRMLALPRSEVEELLSRTGLEARMVDERRDPHYRFSSAVYFASRPDPASSP